jgi:hypothetical protein
MGGEQPIDTFLNLISFFFAVFGLLTVFLFDFVGLGLVAVDHFDLYLLVVDSSVSSLRLSKNDFHEFLGLDDTGGLASFFFDALLLVALLVFLLLENQLFFFNFFGGPMGLVLGIT